MPKPDDASLDTLLSATFAALPTPTPSPTLSARVRQQVEAEVASSTMHLHIVEQQQGNTWTRIQHRTEPQASMPSTPITEKIVTRLRTLVVVNRKGNP